MSNTKSSSKNPNGLLVVVSVSLFALMGAAKINAAPGAGGDAAFDDATAFTPWDGGLASTQRKAAAASLGSDNAPLNAWDGGLAAAKKKFAGEGFNGNVLPPSLPPPYGRKDPNLNPPNPPPAKPTPPPSPVPIAASTIAGIAGSQIINWTFNLDNLSQRMGEVRLENLAVNNGGDLHYNGNLWARAYADRVNGGADIAGSSFHQYTYGASVGADKAFVQEPNFTVLAGLMGDISKTNRFLDNSGGGSSRDAGIGFYATVLSCEGWFADFAGRVDALNTKFNVYDPDNVSTINGSYTTNMETLSIEAGRVLKRADGWWIEPSVQAAVAWAAAGSADITPSGQPLRVKINSSRDLQYRAMVRVGRQVGDSHWYPYGKFAVAKVDTVGGVVHVGDDLGVITDYKGPRVELGFGTTYRIDEFNQIYFDYTFTKSHNYNSPWSTNLGYRLLW